MKLITLAHYGEAQSIIDRFSLSKKSSELYQNDELTLLLTGEGPFEACASVSFLLGQKKFSEVINLGIAGALDKKLSVGEIFEIRSIYLVIEGRLQYKTFNQAGQKDLITSFERILGEDKAHSLSGFGDIVDREAWGVAFSCKEHRVPFRSFKVISDVAGSIGACEAVKENAQEFSLKLLAKLEEILGEVKETHEKSYHLGDEFYFTFSLKHRLHHLVEMITLRDEITALDVFKKIDLAGLKELNITPKARAKLLIEKLELELDPFKGKLHEALTLWKEKYQGVDISTDPQWESQNVKFSFTVQSKGELETKLKLLDQVDLEPFYQILQGKVDVE